MGVQFVVLICANASCDVMEDSCGDYSLRIRYARQFRCWRRGERYGIGEGYQNQSERD